MITPTNKSLPEAVRGTWERFIVSKDSPKVVLAFLENRAIVSIVLDRDGKDRHFPDYLEGWEVAVTILKKWRQRDAIYSSQ